MRDFFFKKLYIYKYIYISLYSLYLCSFYEIKIAVFYMYNVFDNYAFLEVY